MGHSDVDVKRLSLIDVSFEDDRLIDTSACFVSPLFSVDQSIELSPGLDLQKFQEKGKTMASKPLELVEERSSKTPENYNLRKSLAWDTAFFTSDGVLEPEELSSMIEDAGKKEKRTLPMILEETQRSTESISTLAFDSLTLTSLEDGLFEDIRASIQKSRKTSNIQTFGSEAGQSFSKAHAHPSLRKTDVASHDKLKPKPATKKSSLGMNRPEKTTGQVPVHRRVSQTAAVGGASNSNSLPSKPPNLRMRSLLPSSAKRESMTANCMKPKKNSTEGAIGRGASVPKVPLSSGSRSTGPRPSSSRSSFVCSISAKTDMMTTPPESSGTGSSDRTGKSPGILRKKSAVTGSRKLSSASSSKLKTPPRRTLSHLSAHFMSATKLSSSISPSSSISEWSSDSSSSTSIIEQRSNGSSASLKLGSSERSNGRQLDGLKTLGSASSTLHLKNASTRGALLLPNSMRPSGLRMPSPKIGFFDGMISERTLHLDQQSPQVIPSGLPKIGVEISKPDGNINKVKVVKFQSATTTTAMDSMRGDSKQSYLVGSCKSLPPDSSNSVNKVSSMCESMKCPHGLSPTVQGRPPKFGSWNQSKAEEVKAKETYPVTWDDKESAEAEPGSGAWSCKTNAIHGELYISNAIMDLLDGAGSPDKWESHVDHGSVFDYSACTSAFVSQESPHL